ncbi:MAG: valine--tRNA ligase [Candidatus Didemnitutus sp.]|nr:valine--tRNA ligase [Candidatus Didemnitutus sp.]
MASITKSYEPRDVEKKWYAAWQAAEAFAGRVTPGKEPYTIVIPPPNVTGVLTMGHVLNNTIQDILIRRARLEGKEAMWLPGTDHAGIATQTVVERELRKQKQHRRDLGREKFLEKVWSWREEKGGIILKQLQALGASCDWSRTQFTMDPHYSQAVLNVFVDLFAKGHIYRGKRMVNWCPVSLTALSDEEVIMKPAKGFLYQVRYERVDAPGEFITVKTTRPETIPGDVAIAVHPDDPRYAGWIGQKVRRPLGPTAEIPIIADSAVDKEFGSGALKITPAHDKVDFEIGQRHKLPPIDVLNADGTLNELAGPELAGMDRFAGRKKAAELLKERGALVKEEPYENNVGFSERADVPIEPRLTWQWWLKYPRVEEAKTAVRDGHIKFHPERWSKVYLHWLENIQDWCISRQLWWGHRIPVWYRKGLDKEKLTEADLRDATKVHVSLAGPADPENWVQEDDVLDTWASSWLWPFATLGWPDAAKMQERGYDYFYPTSTLVTGPDIIFFWVARMIMAGLEYTHEGQPLEKRVPFKDVYFTGIIRDQQGRKMSKSLGNSPDPLDLIATYGADGLRFGIISIAPQGQDIRFQEDRIETGKNFCNKLWNACRFRQMSGDMADNSSLAAVLARLEPAKFDAADHAILDRLLETTRAVKDAFFSFEFSGAVQALYGFFWNDFCDSYVEFSKGKLQDASTKASCLAIQDLVLRQTLLLLHPFTPFITEELWHLLGYGVDGQFLMRDVRLESENELAKAIHDRGIVIDKNASRLVQTVHESASVLKASKAASGMAGVKFPTIYIQPAPGFQDFYANDQSSKFARIFETGSFQVGSIHPALTSVTGSGTFYIPIPERDTAAEKAKHLKELETLAKHIAGTEARLSNEAFVSKAPPAVLDGARKQLADLKAKQAEVQRLLAALG